MQKIKMFFGMIVSLFIVFGCTKALSKPEKQVLVELSKKSAIEVILDVDSKKNGLISNKYGTHAVDQVSVVDVKLLSEPAAGEYVKRKDKNGIERDVWVVDVSAEEKVLYNLHNNSGTINRTEKIKYKMFVYKTNDNKYLYETGVIESYEAPEFWDL